MTNGQIACQRANAYHAGGVDAIGAAHGANAQCIAIHIGQAAHAAGGQGAYGVAGVGQCHVATLQQQLVGRHKAAGAFGNGTAGNQCNGVGAGGCEPGVQRNVAAVNADRPCNALRAADRNVCRVASLAQGQARECGAQR